MIATLVIIGVAVLIAAWDPIVRRASAHPSEKECRDLLERYVEHVAYAVDPSPKTTDVADRKAKARAAAERRAAFARCESDLTRRELDCAMKAPNADEFERCLP